MGCEGWILPEGTAGQTRSMKYRLRRRNVFIAGTHDLGSRSMRWSRGRRRHSTRRFGEVVVGRKDDDDGGDDDDELSIGGVSSRSWFGRIPGRVPGA